MNRRQFTAFSRTLVSAAAAIVVAAPAFAQNTTAGVAGQVTGADGEPGVRRVGVLACGARCGKQRLDAIGGE